MPCLHPVFTSAVLLALGISAADGDLGTAPGSDGAELRGTWEVASWDTWGNRAMDAIGVRLTFAGGVIRISKTPLDIYGRATYTLNSSRRPWEIDVSVKADSDEYTILGIYYLDGDTATFCLSAATDPNVIHDDPMGFIHRRPKEFSSRTGSLVVLKRVEAGAGSLWGPPVALTP